MSIRAAFLTSFARRGGQATLHFAAGLILARLLLPEDLGIFAVALALLAILAALRETGATRYIIKEKDLSEAKIRTVFGFTLLVGWSLALLIWSLRHQAAEFYAEPQMAGIFTILAANFLAVPIGQPAMALLRRERRYGELAILGLCATAASVAVAVVLAWRGFGAASLAWGSLAEVLVAVALALWFRPDHIRLMPSLREWREVGGFSGLASAEMLIVAIGVQLPQVLIGKFFAFAEAGLYVRGQRLASIIRIRFIGSITWVTGAEFGARHRAGGELGALAGRITGYTLSIAWPVLVFLGFKAEGVILLLFGPNWTGAAPFLQILCLGQAIQIILGQAQPVYEATGDIRLKFRNETLLQAVSVGLLLLTLPISLEAVAWSRTGLALAAVAVHLSVFNKHAGIGARQMPAILRTPLVVTVLFAAVLLALDAALARLTANPAYATLTEAAALAVLFPGILLLVNRPLLADLLKILPARWRFGF